MSGTRTEMRFKRNHLAVALLSALTLPLAGTAIAQEADETATDAATQSATTLDKVEVTGSLIPRAQIETSTPTFSITLEDMKRQGHKNVYEALRSMPMSTGAVQDSQFTNSFTPGANVVSMFGMDPGFVLYLVNGKPLADYPMLYNSTGTIVDLSGIPTIAVERIDIVPGNQSATYGSSAIAGVINVITKQHIDKSEFNVRMGTYTEGGGSNSRFQFITGYNNDRFDSIVAVEVGKQDPIYKHQRDGMESTKDNPTTPNPIPSRNYLLINGLTGGYQDVDPARCDAVSSQFNNTVHYFDRPGFGSYCGTFYDVGYGTLMNKRDWTSVYGNASFDVNDNVQLYGAVMYTDDKVSYTNGFSTFWWGTNAAYLGSNYIYDVTTGLPLQTQRVFTPEEVGTLADSVENRTAWDFNGGIRGHFGDSSWDYDLSYHRSEFQNDKKNRRLLADSVNEFFLGEELNVANPYGIGSYALNYDRFYGALTQADILSITDFVRSDASTHKQDLRAQVTNTDLFSLPAGSVGMAFVLQTGDQAWDQPRDPRVANGEFWGTGSTGGSGSRDNSAAALEFNVPIFSMLTANVAVRYDEFENGEGFDTGDSDTTYKVGLEFRPVETLLVRGNYGTAFRAPEMSYIFADPSLSFSNVTDSWQCRRDNGNVAINPDNCGATLRSVQVRGTTSGNPDLKSVTAESWGVGFVWSPISNFNLRADYLNLKVDNKVASRTYASILNREADCRLGATIGGTPVDGNSGECREILSLVSRLSATDLLNPNGISQITTYPLNVAKETVENVNVGANYMWEAGRFGDITLSGNYFLMLDHTSQTFPEDEPTDWLAYEDYGVEFRNIGNFSVGWAKDRWSANLLGTRYGRTWNYAATEKVGPWIVFNGSVGYNFSDDASITLIANNLTNRRPPKDETFAAYPYFDLFSYNAFGRALYLEFNYGFGGRD